MNLNEYQKAAYKTAIPPSRNVEYMILGLASEAGEVCGAWKKSMRDGTPPDLKDKVANELGDALWYIAGACTVLGITLDDIAEANILKLSDRLRRDAIKGSGDDR